MFEITKYTPGKKDDGELLFSKTIRKTANKICIRMHEQIKYTYEHGYDWIGFEYDFTRDFEIRFRAKMAKGEFTDADKYHTIYDLKLFRVRSE